MKWIKQHWQAILAGFVLGFFFTFWLIGSGAVDPESYVSTRASISNDWGQFPQRPRVEFLNGKGQGTLLRDFVYIDPYKRPWLAMKHDEINGASIPQVLWSVLGGPFEGRYLNASVVHDTACVRKTERWEDVHRMFYMACRCSGVGEKQGKLLYAGVYHGGPRWDKIVYTASGRDVPLIKTSEINQPRSLTQKDVEELKKYIDEHNPSLDEIDWMDSMNLPFPKSDVNRNSIPPTLLDDEK